MPNPNQQVALLKRTPVDEWELRKQNQGEKLGVYARPVDAFVSPVKLATDAAKPQQDNSIQNLLEEVGKLPGVYTKMTEASKKENEAKAIGDQRQGIYDNPRDKGWFESFVNPGLGYNEKWNTLHGEAKMAEARQKAEAELQANNFFVNDPERDKKVSEVINKNYSATGLDPNNVWQMAGATHEYDQLKTFADAGVAKSYWDQKTTEHVNDVGTRISTLIRGYRTKLQTEGGKFNPLEARELFGSVRYQIDPNLVPPEKQSQVIVNAILDDTRKQVDTIIKLAREGKADLSDAEDLKNDVMLALQSPDSSGYNWYTMLDKNGKPITGDIIDAHEVRFNAALEQAEQKIERANEKIYQNNYGFYANKMLRERNRDNLAKYMDVITKAYEDGELDEAHLKGLTEFNLHLLNTDANVIENPKDLSAFWVNIYQGNGKESAIYKKVAEGAITRHTAEKALGIIERIKAHEESLAAEGRSRDFVTWQMMYSQQHSNLRYRFLEKGDTATFEAAEAHFNSLVHDKKMPPTMAYKETLKAFPDSTISSIYPSVDIAAAAYKQAKVDLKSGKITKQEYDNVEKNFSPWVTSRYYKATFKTTTSPTK